MKAIIMCLCITLVVLIYGSTSGVPNPKTAPVNYWDIYSGYDTVYVTVNNDVDMSDAEVAEMMSKETITDVKTFRHEKQIYALVKLEHLRSATNGEIESFKTSLKPLADIDLYNDWYMTTAESRLYRLLSENKSILCSLCAKVVYDYEPYGYSPNDTGELVFMVLVPKIEEEHSELQTNR